MRGRLRLVYGCAESDSQLTLDLYEAVKCDALDEARKVFYKQLPVLEFISKGGLPTTVKAGLRIQGFDAGVPRAPLKPLPDTEIKRLEALLNEVGKQEIA